MSEFTKHDQGKPIYALIPPEFEEALAKVLTYGANNPPGRTEDNWKSCPTPVKTYYSALRRHLRAFLRGDRIDPDTGESHLAHAGCCLAFLYWFEQQGRLEDDALCGVDRAGGREVRAEPRVDRPVAPRFDHSGEISY